MSDYPTFCTTDADRAAFYIAVNGGWADQIRYKADLRAIEQGCYFSLEQAEFVRSFMERCLYVAPGQPFTLLQWQWEDVVKPVYGWLRPDGSRRFREVYCEVSKSNGKSFLCSAIALYMLVGEGMYGAEIYNSAADRLQAEVVFKECAKFVENSPVLRSRLKVVYSTKRIILKGKTGVPVSMIRALSRDSYNSQGIKAFALICDEVHIWRDREAFGSLRYSASKVENSLLLMITTAGSDRTSIGWDEHSKARKLISGITDHVDAYAVIYAADEKDNIQDEATWRKANPALGVTIRLDEIKSAASKARDSVSEEMLFRRYRLNQWVHGNDRSWLDMDSWSKCKPCASIAELLGKPCWAGLDLSSTDDLTALVLAFPDDEEGFHLLPYFFCPEDTIVAKTQRQNIPYTAWAKEGLIQATPGNYVDKKYVLQRIKEIGEQFRIELIALDRNWQGDELYRDLTEAGFRVNCFNQGHYHFSQPSKNFEILVKSGRLRHGDHKVLTWNASNCTIQQDRHGNIKPVKPDRGNSFKVDGVIAAIQAIAVVPSAAAYTGSPVEIW